MNKISATVEIETTTRICERHGEFTSKKILDRLWTGCPACGAEHEEKQRENERKEAELREINRWKAMIGNSGIPDRFQNRTIGNFIAESEGQKKALEFASDFAESFDTVMKTGRSALFIGKPGTGKTHLAAAIGLRVMNKYGHQVLFTTVMRVIRRIKDTWSRGSEESESQAVAAFVFPSLLILDEVGVQFGSEFEKNILFDIINERYERRLPTILLSNLPVKDISAYLGERVIDRIREDGGARIVFDWESYRKKAVAE